MPKFKIPLSEPDEPSTKGKRNDHFHPKPPFLFDGLLPCIWRDVPFPVTSMRVSLAQDLVEHKYWGRDGANVEATGRAPLQFEAVIPFVNGIVPGKGEQWTAFLYPDGFRKFLDAFADRKTGVLQHPALGEITCKPQSLDFAHDAQMRAGVEVTARWVETVLPNDDGRVGVGDSPVDPAFRAGNLDAQLARAPIKDLPQFDETFEDAANRLAGVFDTAASRFKQLVNKPNQILYRIKRVQNSVERAKNALMWPITDSYERLKEVIGPKTVNGSGPVQGNGRTPSRKTVRFLIPERMTLADLQALFPTNSLDDLIYLNPRLIARPTVPAKTVIRRYV